MCVSFCTIWCIFSAQIASKLSQVYSHTNFSFEYIISLKIIHVEDFFVMQAWLIWKCYTKKFKNKQSQGVHFQSIWRYLHVFNVCAGLSKKALDMPLHIPKKLTFSEIYISVVPTVRTIITKMIFGHWIWQTPYIRVKPRQDFKCQCPCKWR